MVSTCLHLRSRHISGSTKSVSQCLRAAFLSHQHVSLDEAVQPALNLVETINSQLSNYWFFLLFSAALAVNKKAFYPSEKHSPLFFFLISFCKEICSTSGSQRDISRTSHDKAQQQWWSTDTFLHRPIFTCLIYDPRLQSSRFLPFSDGRAADISFLSSTADTSLPLCCSASTLNPSISFSFVHIFCAPSRFSPSPLGYSSVSPHALSPPLPRSDFVDFLHLCYVMALWGRGHFNQYFKQPGPPGGLAPNATWQHDRMTFEEGGERQPRNTYCCQRCSDLRLGGGNGARTLMRAIRDHWREEEIWGESKNNGLIKTHSLGDTSPGWFIRLAEIKARRINRNRIIHTVASEGQQKFTFKRVVKWHTLCLG